MRLQTRVLAVAVPLTCVFAVAATLASRRLTENVMVRELGVRLAPQAQDAAAGLAPALARRDEAQLLARLQAAQAATGAAFAEALDADGTVAAHTNVLEKGKRRPASA
ncbi:MAG: hypothetical protein AB1725_10575, partial [Armatimonadota bacterium]